MQRIIYICDVCGEECQPSDMRGLKVDAHTAGYGLLGKLDFCPECRPRVVEFLDNIQTAYDALVRNDLTED